MDTKKELDDLKDEIEMKEREQQQKELEEGKSRLMKILREVILRQEVLDVLITRLNYEGYRKIFGAKHKVHIEPCKMRMIREYKELKLKADKLYSLLVKHEAGTLTFELTCPIELLEHQYDVMVEYIHILRVRAEIEGVDLNE